MLAKSKFNSIKTLIFQALIDLEISHKGFKTIVNIKEKYERITDCIRLMTNGEELGENNKSIRENRKCIELKIYILF